MKAPDALKFEDLIERRFSYVFEVSQVMIGNLYQWYDYDTGHGEESGKFDIKAYKKNIYFDGALQLNSKKFKILDALEDILGVDLRGAIPTKWLCEDFEDDLRKNILHAIEEKKLRDIKKEEEREKKLLHTENMLASIRSKLSPEEISFLGLPEQKNNKQNKRSKLTK